jgi:glycerol-3-phosphate dehydrogenase
VEHYCTNEWAVHLDDVMVRRTSWHYYHRDAVAKRRASGPLDGGTVGLVVGQQAAETNLKRYAAATASEPASESSTSAKTRQLNVQSILPVV